MANHGKVGSALEAYLQKRRQRRHAKNERTKDARRVRQLVRTGRADSETTAKKMIEDAKVGTDGTIAERLQRLLRGATA